MSEACLTWTMIGAICLTVVVLVIAAIMYDP